jgi:DnaJ domain
MPPSGTRSVFWSHLIPRGSDPRMTLQDAFDLFRRLGVHPEMMSRSDFSMAYYRLARRYHPDLNPAAQELMANINAARTEILRSYRLPS